MNEFVAIQRTTETAVVKIQGSWNQTVKSLLSTAKLINEMNPKKNQNWYISALSLMLPPGTELETDVKRGLFTPLNQKDTLKELKIFLENISLIL